MISFKQKGSFRNTDTFFKTVSSLKYRQILEQYGKEGVAALSAATPLDSGETARSWSYEIVITRSGLRLIWTNSVMSGGAPLAILLQYGHGTRNGGYVQGRDYINPAMQPIFDKMAESLWKGVTGA